MPHPPVHSSFESQDIIWAEIRFQHFSKCHKQEHDVCHKIAANQWLHKNVVAALSEGRHANFYVRCGMRYQIKYQHSPGPQ